MSEGAENDKTKKPEGDKPEVGTSLAPAVEAAGGIDPFLAKASETPEAPASRPFYAKALDYSAHAAMIVGLVGFAWTVSEHVVRRQPSDPAAKPAKLADAATATPVAAKAAATATPAEPAKSDEIGDLRKANQKMAAELRNLHASLEALRTTVVRERTSGDDVHSLSADLDSVKSSLAGLKSEQAAALAQLSGKVEKLQREERAQAVADRAPSRPERQAVDTTTTASIPAPRQAPAEPVRTVPTPPSKPTVLASAEPPARSDWGRPDSGKLDSGKFDSGKSDSGKSDSEMGKADESKPSVIQGWVVRDVYEGVALIEGRRGQMEVVPGVSIPGAGVVKSIDRHGSGWTVTTTKGQVAYAAPMRDYRRGPRDYYGPPRRYDY